MQRKDKLTLQEQLIYKPTMWPLDLDQLNRIVQIFQIEVEQIQSLDYPWQVLNFLRELLFGAIKETTIDPSVEISDKAHVEGPVFIDKGVKILPFAVIIGPCFIGKNTLVGNHTQLRHSYIGDNSLIGGGTEIIRSICLDGTSFHASYIGDSLIMPNVNFGGGAGAANLRTDYKPIMSRVNEIKVSTGMQKLGVIVGANTMIAGRAMFMPGVKVGENCEIGPGATVYSDVPDNSRLVVKQEQVISKIIEGN